MDQRFVRVHAIDHDGSSSADIVDRVVCQLLDPGGLDHYVKPVRVVLFQLLPLRAWVLPVELDILVRSSELLRDVHLDTLVSGDDDTVRAIQFEQLSEDEACRPCTEEEDLNSDRRVELVETVKCACCGLEERRLLIGDVLDDVALALVVDDVFCESTVESDTACVEVFAKNGLAPPAVEAVVALRSGEHDRREYMRGCILSRGRTYGDTDVCDDAVTDLEVLYVLALLDDASDRFMARNELRGNAIDVSKVATASRSYCTHGANE